MSHIPVAFVTRIADYKSPTIKRISLKRITRAVRQLEAEYCIIKSARVRVELRVSGIRERAVKKAKKVVFSAVKAVKLNARDRLGSPAPTQVIPDPKQKAAMKPKHKETLADLLEKNMEGQ